MRPRLKKSSWLKKGQAQVGADGLRSCDITEIAGERCSALRATSFLEKPLGGLADPSFSSSASTPLSLLSLVSDEALRRSSTGRFGHVEHFEQRRPDPIGQLTCPGTLLGRTAFIRS